MHRPLALWQAIKLSDWSGRFLAAAACLAQRARRAEKFAIGGVIEHTADTALFLDTPLFRDSGCVIRPAQGADLEGIMARLNDGTQAQGDA